MDGGAFSTHWQQTSVSAAQLSSITDALKATLDPRISNNVRQEALQHLEQVKSQPDAPQNGFKLAEDWNQNDAVRYYGLQLLEFAVRYRWTEYNAAQAEQLGRWVRALAGSIREQDPLYIRNKIAQLWVEVAKRCWGDEWSDMDAHLLTLWDKPLGEKGIANKLFVLYVLETLSEDIINSEDHVAGLRLDVLGNALNEVMIPQGLYEEHMVTRGQRQEVRSGSEGWLARVCTFFSECVKETRVAANSELSQKLSLCAVKALNTLRPTMTWISIKATVEVNCIDCLFLPFHTEDLALQTAATEVLYALLIRPYNAHWHDASTNLLQQSLQSERISLIRQAYERSGSGPGEDDIKYTLQKKMSEVLSLLADAVVVHPELATDKLDIPAFFDLLILVLQSKSLLVSIPVLHSWSKLMGVQDGQILDFVLQALGTLVQTCSERLIKYESLPEEYDDPIVQFLFEDFDTMPERHAFLGNYRRYCVSIIQAIARSKPLEALSHVLEQMRNMLQEGPYTVARGFDPAKYSKNAVAVLQFDAQFTVVTSALKGFGYWCNDVSALLPEDELHTKAEGDRASASESLQQWSFSIINMHVDDPEVAAQVLQVLVSILRTIKPEPGFVLQVVQHLLTMRLYDNPAHTTFSDAVKAFEGLRVLELQKLALAFSNELLAVYHELEPRIGILAQKHEDDPRLVWGYKAFLFMIIHRAQGLDNETRSSRLQQMLKPVYDAWQDPSIDTSSSGLEGFCNLLGMRDLSDFYRTYGFDKVKDWSTQQLDQAGQAKQSEIKVKTDRLPLRMTKSMLAAATEKLKSSTEEYEVVNTLWSGLIPTVLIKLLPMLRHAQAFHNISNWSQLPEELQTVIKKTLQDRFWQSGISNESKDEFYARISGSKSSYEGFASVVRGTMRNIREQGYHIIYLMTKFDEQFFSHSDLNYPLSDALFGNAGALSANHLHPIINLTTGLVQRCPPHYRATFLPPLLTQLFTKLDAKISAEWQNIGNASQQKADGDELSDEMRLESVLRQLTYSMVSFVPFILEFDKQTTSQQANGHGSPRPYMSDVILADTTILEPMILFCTHALGMRDTRCCSTICKVFRNLVPLFQNDQAPAPQVREFMCTEVLKACITSLHEPYFADMQKDLAALISQILRLYCPKTSTPRDVLLSLPDMSEAKVDKALGKINKASSERSQRALVLDLLESVRGISIYEAGKIARAAPKPANKPSAMQQQYMEVEQRPAIINGDETGLESVANLFGDA